MLLPGGFWGWLLFVGWLWYCVVVCCVFWFGLTDAIWFGCLGV